MTVILQIANRQCGIKSHVQFAICKMTDIVCASVSMVLHIDNIRNYLKINIKCKNSSKNSLLN